MKKRLYIVAVLSALAINITFAQKRKLNEAKKQYEDLSYVKTTETLEKLVAKGNESSEVIQNLANAYYFNGKMENASKMYAKLIALNDDVDAELYFRFSQSLKAQKQYMESDEAMEKFSSLNPEDSRAKYFMESKHYLPIIDKLSDQFTLKNLDINTKNSDFGVSFYDSEIYFASSRGTGKKYKWNGQTYLDIYKKGDSLGIQEISGDVNTKYHESSTTFSKDGKTMYFTRNNYLSGKFKKNSKQEHSLKVYKATLENGEWTNVESLPFNNDEYSVAHPALSADNSKLYFASDMPGTIGGSDIFVVSIYEDGTYGEPKNLGSKINTEGRENFPYISNKGTLYFSSDSRMGLGGLDVYEFENIENIVNSNETVYNVGRPINSPKDDFGYIINETTLQGYFASNRSGGKGDDDIYSFTRNKLKQIISGVVIDNQSQDGIKGALVKIYDKKNNKIKELATDENGRFVAEFDYLKQTYRVDVIKPDYKDGLETFIVNTKLEKSVELKIPLKTDIPIGTDLSKYLSLNPVYFDFDKSNIRPDAAIEIEKVIAFLKEHPNLKIDVKSHTDSRAPSGYNEDLSGRRNLSTIAHIVENGGIASDRLTGQGYGERELINRCNGKVKCTEAEHQQNRRSEFIVVLH